MINKTAKNAALGLLIALFAGAALGGQPRSMAERAAFVRHHPCPSTGLNRGACPGWEVDHVLALCAGGADSRWNMQWLSVAEHRGKSRTDRAMCRALR